MHAARQFEALRHRHEFGVLQHLGLGNDSGAADFALAVGVGQEHVQRADALHQALVQELPFVPRDHPRNDVEGNGGLRAVGRAVGAESDAVTTIELVDLVARGGDALG